ncbi:hypothetical protein HOF26_02495 [bacterium]|jgi:hypothetical protein|nr:hypothetical protein [bacterium]
MNKINTRLIAIIMLSLPAIISATGTSGQQVASSSSRSNLIALPTTGNGTYIKDIKNYNKRQDHNNKIQLSPFTINSSKQDIFKLTNKSVKTNDSKKRLKYYSQIQVKINQLPKNIHDDIRKSVAEYKDKLMKEKARKNK